VNEKQRLGNLKTNFCKKYEKSGRPCDFSRYVVARANVFKNPRQFYNFVNAKRKSSALPSWVRLNSIEAFTDPEIADIFAEFF